MDNLIKGQEKHSTDIWLVKVVLDIAGETSVCISCLQLFSLELYFSTFAAQQENRYPKGTSLVYNH